MDISFFLRGLLLGFTIAAVVGPMCILCVQRTLQHGRLYGLISGMGIATADAVYGCIAAFGLTFITAFLVDQRLWIRGVGGLFLLYLGAKTLLSKPTQLSGKEEVYSRSLLTAYTSTFLLTLTNPTTILSFATIFAGLGVGASSSGGYFLALLLVLGVFCGSALWWFLLTGALSPVRTRFKPTWLLWLNRVAGVALLLFGLLALLSLRQG